MAESTAVKLSMLSVSEGTPAPELGAPQNAAADGAAAAPSPPQADDHAGTVSAPLTRQAAALVDGMQTDVVVQSYDNLVFCIVTQNQKLGTFVSHHLRSCCPHTHTHIPTTHMHTHCT